MVNEKCWIGKILTKGEDSYRLHIVLNFDVSSKSKYWSGFYHTLFFGINTVILDSTLCKLIQLLIAYTLRNLVCIIQWYFNVYQWNRWISALRRRAFFSFNKYEWAKAADWSWNYYSLSAENFSSTCIVWIAVEQITACWKSLKIFKWYLLPCKYVLVCTKT